SSRRRHTRFSRNWSSDVCSSDLTSSGTTSRGKITDYSMERCVKTLRRKHHKVLRVVVVDISVNVMHDFPRPQWPPQLSLSNYSEIGRASCRERVSISVCGVPSQR